MEIVTTAVLIGKGSSQKLFKTPTLCIEHLHTKIVGVCREYAEICE